MNISRVERRISGVKKKAYLMEKVPRLVGWQTTSRDDVIEELAARDELHDDKNIRRSVDHFIEADDVRMRAHFEDVDLAADLLGHLHVLDLAFVQNLHRHLQACDDVVGNYTPIFKEYRKWKAVGRCERRWGQLVGGNAHVSLCRRLQCRASCPDDTEQARWGRYP